MSGVGWLTAFSSMGRGREVGGVRFEHEGTCGGCFDRFDDGVGVFEGSDTGEGDESSGGEDAFGEFGWSGEAMEDRADGVGIVCVDL